MNYQSLEKKSDKLFINEYVSVYKCMLYSVEILRAVTSASELFTKPFSFSLFCVCMCTQMFTFMWGYLCTCLCMCVEARS